MRSSCLLSKIILQLGVVVFFIHAAPAQAKYASIVIEAQSGTILHAVNPYKQYHPASMTKLMTLFLTFEQLNKGALSMDEKVNVSKNAARQPASKLWLEPGEKVSVHDLVLGIITRSGNDAAVALAERIAGSEHKFAQMMTQKALDIGMQSTRFYNASGLPDTRQVSTPRDIALMVRTMMIQFPQYYHLFSTKKFAFHGGTVLNHNKFLTSYKGADGLKTGYISDSGYNLAASAVRNGTRIIAVIFGGLSSDWRDKHMTKLMDYGFYKANKTLAQKKHATPFAQLKEPKLAAQKLGLTPTSGKPLPAPKPTHVPIKTVQKIPTALAHVSFIRKEADGTETKKYEDLTPAL